MPSKKVWQKVHDDLMAKLNLPCKLRFSTEVIVGRHSREDDGTCFMTVNPKADFRVPAHLILHEAAHHRVCEPWQEQVTELEEWCHRGWGGHCEHWAKVLCDMYEETGTSLPETTSFFAFAKAAGITRKNFAREGDLPQNPTT